MFQACYKNVLEGVVPNILRIISNVIHGSIHRRATRQKNQLHLLAVRTETAKRSFYYHGCTDFNSFMQ